LITLFFEDFSPLSVALGRIEVAVIPFTAV
jgi:hypothetical protein